MTRYELDEQVKEFTQAPEATDDEAGAAPRPFPIWPWPWSLQVSGLYEHRRRVPIPRPTPLPIRPVSGDEADVDDEAGAALFHREEIRLDVDGRYPQMQVSGTRYTLFTPLVHWIAKLRPAGNNTWVGQIWYKDGNTGSLPQTTVKVSAQPSFFANQRKVTITYGGGGGASFSRTYPFKSSSFHPVEFEYDTVEGATAVTAIDTCDHPNRPASLPCEKLRIETVFRRAGFRVAKSGDDEKLPLSLAGADARWSDMEMHDAMQTYWSRFANKAQWSLWVLFAALHERGAGLGGVMYDDIGPNHRQGTAIFSDSFISNPPAGDPDPAAWVARMRFWTACHEMGHAFNLAHSWQKSLGAPYGTPWIPLADEPEARSFMNYPYNVSGGPAAFFADFEYRFSDAELLFMRHAPARFVQMGNADWFDHHGFEHAAAAAPTALRLIARVERDEPVFAYLEPPVIRLELTNASDRPRIVHGDVLDHTDGIMMIIKKRGGRARQWLPYARYCTEAEPVVLMPGQSISGSVFAAAGRNGWDLAEPGVYTVQVALKHDEELIVSKSAHPQGATARAARGGGRSSGRVQRRRRPRAHLPGHARPRRGQRHAARRDRAAGRPSAVPSRQPRPRQAAHARLQVAQSRRRRAGREHAVGRAPWRSGAGGQSRREGGAQASPGGPRRSQGERRRHARLRRLRASGGELRRLARPDRRRERGQGHAR